MGKNTLEKRQDFNNFVTQQTAGQEDEYEYSNSETIKNRLRTLFLSSKQRLKETSKMFLKSKKGTCWELSMSYDYHLLSQGKKNHHLVALSTGSLTCHVFNILVEDGILHITDLFQNLKDVSISNYDDFMKALPKMFKDNYEEWYVLSEVKNNFSEHFKRLGMKKWAKFCSKTADGGGFVIIDKDKKTFTLNDSKNIGWKFTPFKFPAFG